MYDARMAQRSQRPRAAIAFKAHTGWAAALVAAEAGEGIEILAKERVKMRDGFQAAAVYHVGHEQGLTSDQARPMIENARRESVVRAKKAIAAIAESVAGRCSLERAAVLAGGGRPLPDLDAILRSHPLVHTAEVFTTGNASTLESFAAANGIQELSFWSLGRDKACSSNGQLSDSCSGTSQSQYQFSTIFNGLRPNCFAIFSCITW